MSAMASLDRTMDARTHPSLRTWVQQHIQAFKGKGARLLTMASVIIRDLPQTSGKTRMRYVTSLLFSLLMIAFFFHVPGRSWHMNQANHSHGRHAFATMLSPFYNEEGIQQTDVAADKYFTATRVLLYQLRHAASTAYQDRTVPFLVMTPPGVDSRKTQMLESEGATIVPVELISSDWIHPTLPRWSQVLSKLWLWTYTQYDRILFLDADILLAQPLDGIFDDVAAQPVHGNATVLAAPRFNISCPLPETYVLGGIVDGASGNRSFPKQKNYLNAGFFLIQPDRLVFDCLMQFVQTPYSFSAGMPEQDLMNRVFQRGGEMPWQSLTPTWDTTCPESDDIAKGYKTVHGKWWDIETLAACPLDAVDPWIGRQWYRVLGHMESYYATKSRTRHES